MRLRQVALVARDLDPVVEALCRVLGIEVAYRDPGVGVFGLRNAVLPVGETFLEVVSPERPDTSAGRFLERRGGDGGYMVIVQTDPLDAARRRVSELGVRIVWETTLEDAATIHLHPRDLGGAILSLDAMDPPDSWRWAGPAWKGHVRTDVTLAIAGVEIEARDPAAMAARWSGVLARPASASGAGEHEITLDSGSIRFAPEREGRGEGVSSLLVRARDPEELLERAREAGSPVSAAGIKIGGVHIRAI
ncbi:MAG: VOC family protein [Myxococcota bacterium]